MRNFLFGFMSCFFMIFLILFICFRPAERVVVSNEKVIEPAIVENKESVKKEVVKKETVKEDSEKRTTQPSVKPTQKVESFADFVGEYTLIDDPASTLFVEKSKQRNSYDFVEAYDGNLEFTAIVSFNRSPEARLSNGSETVDISLNDDGTITFLKSTTRSNRVVEYTYVKNDEMRIQPYAKRSTFKQE